MSVDRKRLFRFRPWREISNLQDLLNSSGLLIDAIIEENAAIRKISQDNYAWIVDAENYIDQAQIVIAASKRKGAKPLHTIGKLLLANRQ